MDDAEEIRIGFDGAAPNRAEGRRIAKALGMAYGDWKVWQAEQEAKAKARFALDQAHLLERRCSECGAPMRAHPEPLYTPCPIPATTLG